MTMNAGQAVTEIGCMHVCVYYHYSVVELTQVFSNDTGTRFRFYGLKKHKCWVA